MENSITNQLKQHLAGLTPEQIDAEWREIEELGLVGPVVSDYLYCPEATYYLIATAEWHSPPEQKINAEKFMTPIPGVIFFY